MSQTIFITKGLPGSGKSTWAKQQVEGSKGQTVRVNKDDLRMMLHAGRYSKANETAVLAARDELVWQALDSGRDVIVDDTNFEPKHEARMREIAPFFKADVKIVDFTDVPLKTCLENNQKRPIGHGYVPPDVIKNMWQRYLKPAPVQPPPFLVGAHMAIIVDVDGTVARNVSRDFFDWSRVGEDQPIVPVIELVRQLQRSGDEILYVSGRDEVCRNQTEVWLDQAGIYLGDPKLFMRSKGDSRDDRIVKRELYDAHIKGKYNVRFVLDDRNKVVDMWRNELGLTCLQCAEGDF